MIRSSKISGPLILEDLRTGLTYIWACDYRQKVSVQAYVCVLISWYKPRPSLNDWDSRISTNLHARKRTLSFDHWAIFFASFTNGISAFSRTWAKVYSLISIPFSNTVSRISCRPWRKTTKCQIQRFKSVKSCFSLQSALTVTNYTAKLNDADYKLQFQERESHVSLRWFSCGYCILVDVEFRVLVFVEGGKPESQEKNPRSKDEKQQQTQPAYGTGSNRPRDT